MLHQVPSSGSVCDNGAFVASAGVGIAAMVWTAIAWLTTRKQQERAEYVAHVEATHGELTTPSGKKLRYSPHMHTIQVRHGSVTIPPAIPECVALDYVFRTDEKKGNFTDKNPNTNTTRTIEVMQDLASVLQCVAAKFKENKLLDEQVKQNFQFELTVGLKDLYEELLFKEAKANNFAVEKQYNAKKFLSFIKNTQFSVQQGKPGIRHGKHVHNLPLGSGSASVLLNRGFFSNSHSVVFFTDHKYDNKDIAQIVGNFIASLRMHMGVILSRQATLPGMISQNRADGEGNNRRARRLR